MGRPSIPKERCVESLIEASEQLGEDFSIREYNKLGLSPSPKTIKKKFDSWNDAKDEAGLEKNVSSVIENQRPPDMMNYSIDEWKDLDKHQRNEMRKRAKWAEEKLSRGCNNCGYDEHPVALSWHHVNPDEKEWNVSTMINRNHCNDKIQKEVDKCEVLCTNCHKIETHGHKYE